MKQKKINKYEKLCEVLFDFHFLMPLRLLFEYDYVDRQESDGQSDEE